MYNYKKLKKGNNMKICVISDSHGRNKSLEDLIKLNDFDYVFFLGDGLNDLRDIEYENIKKVSGNCDFFSSIAETQVFTIRGIKILITHGHKFKVKVNTSLLLKYAKEQGVKLVCYGHTHKSSLEVIDGVMLLNPGAFRDYKYAIVDIDNKGGIGVNFEEYHK